MGRFSDFVEKLFLMNMLVFAVLVYTTIGGLLGLGLGFLFSMLFPSLSGVWVYNAGLIVGVVGAWLYFYDTGDWKK